MTTEVDVAIVGGGPSGASAAHYLASRGHSVLVCEKKAFPREKTCGDGLTPRALKALREMGLGRELSGWERVAGLRVHARGRVLELPFPQLDDFEDYGLVKPRKDLDRVVLDNAEVAGAKVLYETHVVEPLRDGDVVTGVRATRDGEAEDVRAKYVVCAEGSATKLGRALGRDRDTGYPMGLAIRQYFGSPMQHSGWFEAYLGVRAERAELGGAAMPGYGWVFPVGDGTVNAGVGLLSTFGRWRDVNLHHLQDTFISGLPEDWGIGSDTVRTKARAGRLYMGASVWPPHGAGFVLVGDAAGMINPCNGEGIAYGYETGRIAGRHIDEALRNGLPPALEGYTRELEDTYGPYYRLGRRFVELMGHPALMERAMWLGMRCPPVMRFALTMMANLEDRRPHGVQQRGMKMLKKLAELKQ